MSVLSRLGRVLKDYRAGGYSRGDLTVLSEQHDPYRCDVPASRAAAEWFAEQYQRFYRGRTCHVRGLHYKCAACSDILKPNGDVYENTIDDWAWIVRASSSARWLGLVPFDRIVDHKNSPPITMKREIGAVTAAAFADFPAIVFEPDEMEIRPSVFRFDAQQPYTLAIYGEKSSLEDILTPIHIHYGADIYIAEGEQSTTYVYDMAKQAVTDKRPLVLFTLTDCDPSGYNMPVAVGRKLQALRDGFMPSLRYEVVPVALTPGQADEFDLPSKPLKKTEKRGEKWREAFDRDQTEIDAMIALHPNELSTMIKDAIKPYFDLTLANRVRDARSEWREAAQVAIDEQVGAAVEAIRDEAAELLGPYNNTLFDLEQRLKSLAARVTLPPLVIPEARLLEPTDDGVIVSSRWTWLRQTQTLKDRKAYGSDDQDEAA